jgi:hypothetical protein
MENGGKQTTNETKFLIFFALPLSLSPSLSLSLSLSIARPYPKMTAAHTIMLSSEGQAIRP